MIGERARPTVVIVACFAAVAAATVVVLRISSWWLLPAMIAWSGGLVICAVCDATTQRVPTKVVWPASLSTVVLLAVAAILTGVWQPLIMGAVCAGSAGLIFGLCWRFLGLGFGDVRLGILGGLGLGNAGAHHIFTGLAVFAAITAAHAVIAYLRTKDKRATFPMAPALAAGFLTAALM